MTTQSGPYVGPEPFKTEHAEIFFGREREKHELASLVTAHQIVVLYSPSGAGKSSLINAGLIPLLQAMERFTILPPIRFLGGLPKDADPSQIDNPYLFDMVTALAGAASESGGAAGSSMATAMDGIKQRLASAEEPLLPILLFDQFEEIFFRYQDVEEHWVKRARFFQELGAVLAKDRTVRVLFAMREEYLAQFDRHARYLPDAWGARYRLELLDHAAAFDAVTLPLKDTGYAFENDAANWLVADLRRSRVESSTAQTEPVIEVAGEFVEPVQLQIVCLSLWERRTDFPNPITQTSLQEIGNIDQALTRFYDAAVAAAAVVANAAEVTRGDTSAAGVATEDDEIKIREWIEHALISSNGTRRLTDVGSLQEARIPTVALQELVDRHLVRKNERYGGLAWYELTHDRLILPIQESNEVMFAKSLQPFQRQARLWKEQDEPAELLLRGAPLDEASAFTAANAGRLTDDERRFVRLSQEAKKQQIAADRLRMAEQKAQIEALNASKLMTRFRAAVAFAVVAVFATAIALYFFTQAQTEQKREKHAKETAQAAQATAERADATAEAGRITAEAQARSRQVAAQAQRQMGKQLDLALLLSVAANDDAHTAESETSLLTALTTSPHLTTFLNSGLLQAGSVAVSPDGQTVAVGGCTKPTDQSCLAASVRLWDRATNTWSDVGKVDDPILNDVKALAFRPDGMALAAVGPQGLAIWDLPSGQRRTLAADLPPDECRDADFESLAFDAKTATLATGGDDGCVVLWDLAGNRPRQSLKGHTAGVTSVAFSPDGHWLASGSIDHNVFLWDLTTPQPDHNLLAVHGAPVTGVAFNFDGSSVASGSMDGEVLLTDMAQSHPQRTLSPPGDAVLSVAFSPASNVLAAGGNSVVFFWSDLDEHPERLTSQQGAIPSLGFDHDGTMLVSGNTGSTFIIWNTASSQFLNPTLSQLGDSPTGIATDATGTKLAIGTRSGLLLQDVNGAPWGPKLDEADQPVTSVALSPDGTHLAAGGATGVTVWNLTDGTKLPTPPAEEGHIFRSLAFNADSKAIALGDDDGTVTIWDLSNGTLTSGPSLSDEVKTLAYSPNGALLAAGGADGTVVLWDVAKSQLLQVQPATRQKSVTSVAFSPDSSVLAIGGTDSTIILWDVVQQAPRGAPLTGHGGAVQSVAFSRDGELLASGGLDGRIILWDATTGTSLEPPLIVKPKIGWRVLFGTNGRGQVLASAGSDGTLMIWQVDLAAWRSNACAIANRDLSREEWHRYVGAGEPQALCTAGR